MLETDYTNMAFWENEAFDVHYNSNDINVYYYVSLAGEYLYQHYLWY